MRSKVTVIKASKLGNRWDVSFNIDSNLPLPKQGKPIGQIAHVLRGTSILSKNYSDDPLPNTSSYIRISDMSSGKLFDYNIKHVPDKFAKNTVQPGDILLSIRGSIGNVALVSETFANAIPSSQIAIIRLIDSGVDRKYLFRMFSSKYVQNQIQRFTLSAVINYISLSDIRRILIPIVSLDKQRVIVNKIEAIEQQCGQGLGMTEQTDEIKDKIQLILEEVID